MKILKNLAIAVGFMSLGAVGTVGLQAAARGPGFGGPMRHLAHIVDDLNLDADQQAQLEGIRDMMRDHHRQGQEERASKQGEMIDMLGAERLDAQLIHDQIDEKAAEKVSFAHEMADEMIALHATLSPEQKATLIEKAETMQARRAEMRERFESGELDGRRGRGKRDFRSQDAE